MKTRSIFVSIASLLLILSINSCNANTPFAMEDLITEKRSVNDFSELETNGGFEIMIKQGDENALEVQAPERYIDDLLTEVHGDRLVIKMREDVHVTNFNNFKIWLTFRTLKEITSNGAAEIRSDHRLEVPSFSVKINGAAKIDLPVKCQFLEAIINGAGKLNFKGSATQANLTISGAGKMNLLGLEVKKMDVELSGAGNADVFVTGHLKASVSGVGTIRYKGDPTVEKHDNSVFGTIKPY